MSQHIGSRYILGRYRRSNTLPVQEECREHWKKVETDRILKAGIIEPATSEWAIVFVPDKNSSLRFRIDYRRLNAATFKNSYPIPSMDEFNDSLDDAKVFSTLDANWR